MAVRIPGADSRVYPWQLCGTLMSGDAHAGCFVASTQAWWAVRAHKVFCSASEAKGPFPSKGAGVRSWEIMGEGPGSPEGQTGINPLRPMSILAWTNW